MGLLDKLLSRVGRVTTVGPAVPVGPAAQAAAPPPRSTPAPRASSKAPPGPLQLATGDFVSHYRERFIVAGTRCLEGGGSKIHHYCLRDANGAAAVLAVEDGAELVFSMQRLLAAELRWDADSLDVADGRFKLARKGAMKVRSWDDAGVAPSTRSVNYREHRDAEGDRVLVMEDYEGRREVRVGEPVFEAELECERAGVGRRGGVRTAALGGAAAFEDVKDEDVAKGSPRAAARVLEQNVGASKASRRGVDTDDDPSTYVDEWSDAKDVAPEAAPARTRAAARPAPTQDGDEWDAATRLLREKPAARRKTDA